MLREMDTSGEQVTNGISRLGLRHYAIFVDGKCITDDFHGTYWQAWTEWQVYTEAMRNDPTIADVMDTPIDEIAPAYWKNGHIAPLRIEELEADRAWFES